MSTYRTTLNIEIDGLEIEIEAAIEYRYTPGSPAYTPPGEYGPIDPPDPEETDIGEVSLKLGNDELECPKWLVDQLRNSDAIHRALCQAGEQASQPDPDAAYDAMRDDRDFGHGSDSDDPF